jgi:4-hydroxythreonine-4-phosphate dehydrogenase
VTPPRLAVTLGDPAGVGPEVAARTLTAPRALSTCRPLVVGPLQALEAALKGVGAELGLFPAGEADPWAGAPGPDAVPVLDPCNGAPLPDPGVPSGASGRMALESLEAACDLALAGTVDGIVTAPLSKAAVRQGGNAGFVGQTEALQQRSGVPRVRMMMAGGPLRVVLATTHVALAELPAQIDAEGVYWTIRLTHEALVRHEGLQHPRIAVCGLNPHPGEFGHEDAREIAPAVVRARDEGIAAEGPLAADGLFGVLGRSLRDGAPACDAVVAMYHDQGLGPVKLFAPDGVVNVTLGLPFVRTAPGHGTGFDIAGRAQAQGEAMGAALALAARWAAASP